MAELVKYTEWEQCGQWYCNDVSCLSSMRSKWWIPARALGISPADFVKLLIDKFKPSYIRYSLEHNMLIYAWDKQADMRKFKNYINKVFRDRKFKI